LEEKEKVKGIGVMSRKESSVGKNLASNQPQKCKGEKHYIKLPTKIDIDFTMKFQGTKQCVNFQLMEIQRHLF